MPDTYSSYEELAAAEIENVAYERRTVLNSSIPYTSIAIHGGGIEGGSGEAAKEVAAGLMDYYEFAGILPSDNARLHVTSTNFDEPICQGLVAASQRTMSFHGYVGDGSATIALGGLDDVFGAEIQSRLVAAGFNVINAPQEIGGDNPNNICNENAIHAGVQLELSRPLRESFFPGNTTARKVRDSGARTPRFWAFVNAIRQAVFDHVGSQKPPRFTSDCTAEYSARIVDRGGATVADATDLVAVEWNRLLNDTSTASVTVAPDADCCQKLGNVRSWRHSLYIYRNGIYVWGGPVLNVEWRDGEVEVFAGDISAWLARRVPHQSMAFPETSDIADIAVALIDDGFAPDDPGHFAVKVANAKTYGSREYVKNVGQTFDHLQDLSETGIDFTVYGSSVFILPDAFSQTIGSLSDEDLPEGLAVVEDGTSLTTRWVVAGGSNHDIIGEAGGKDAYYGLLERYAEQTTIKTVGAANAAALAKLNASDVAPVFIDTREVTLSPEAPISVASLVPGWSLNVSTTSTCRDITQQLKIVGLKVTMESNDTDQGTEKVAVQVAVTGADRG